METDAAAFSALLLTPYRTVDEVVAGLEGIEAHCWPRRDRRGVFATAYLHITRAIRQEVAAGGFHDASWVARYLVCFGNLYRLALLRYERGEKAVPKAWRMSFNAAQDRNAFVIQHLLLGINAHINHDLALALVEVGIDPERERRYADHTRVNEVLEIATATMKSEVSRRYAPLLSRLDRLGGRLDDDATNFSIPRAREHAWTFALALTSCTSEAETRRLQQALDTQAAVLARLILASPTRHPIVVQTVRVAKKVDRVLRRLVPFWSRR